MLCTTVELESCHTLQLYWEIIPRTTGVNLPWTTPIGFSGWLSTGSWTASCLAVIPV